MVSQNYINASVQSLLQTIADLAGRAADLNGQLADAKDTIAQQQAKLDELEKAPPAA